MSIKRQSLAPENASNALLEMILCRGNGVLQSCAATRDFKTLKGHIRRGVDVNIQNEYAETALYVAAYYGEETMVDVLLQFGADPNIYTNDGNTPLHAAAHRGHARILERLISAGGDLRLSNFCGQRVRELVNCGVDGDNPIADVLRKAFEVCEQLTSGAGLSPSKMASGRSSRQSHGSSRRLTFMDDGRRCDATSGLGHAGLRNVTLEHSGFGSFVCQGGRTLGYVCHLPIIDQELDLQPDRGAVESYRCGAFSHMVSEAWRGIPVSVRRVDAASALKEGCDRGLTSLLLNQAVAEAKAISSLRHPHILTMMGISPTYHPQTCDLTTSLVFERCHLGSLYHHLHVKFERCTPLVALTIMRQISEALLFVHHSGIIHCGVTSHAIHLIGPDTAKLGNFEYATPSGHRSTAVINTHPNALYNWLSPEAIQNDPVTTAMDVYSLATVVCECFIGEIPQMDIEASQLLDSWSPPFGSSRLRESSDLPDSVRGVLRAAVGEEARSRPALHQLHRLLVYAFWNIYDQMSSPSKKQPWYSRTKHSATQHAEDSDSSVADELCVTALEMPATVVRPRRPSARRVASFANASSSAATTTTSNNMESIHDDQSRGRRPVRARTLSGGEQSTGSKPPLGSRHVYRRLAAVPKSPKMSNPRRVELNLSKTRSSSEEDVRMKPASHRVSREPNCVNIGDLTGTADLIRTASRPSSGHSTLLTGMHAHSTPVETTTTSNSASTSATNFSPDNKGRVKARARCYRSEVHLELEMPKDRAAMRQDFPRVGDLIQRYESGDSSRSPPQTDPSSQSFPTPFMTALETDTLTPTHMRPSSPSDGTDPEALRRLLREIPGCVVLVDGDTARRLNVNPDVQSSDKSRNTVINHEDWHHATNFKDKERSKRIDFFTRVVSDGGVTMKYEGHSQDTKTRGRRNRGATSPQRSGKCGKEEQKRPLENQKDEEEEDWGKDSLVPDESLAREESAENTWDCIKPDERWGDAGDHEDDNVNLDETNDWDRGVEWPEEKAPVPADSLDTTGLSLPEATSKDKKSPSSSKPSGSDKKKKSKNDEDLADGGWMQTAVKMARDGLEMLGRRSNVATDERGEGKSKVKEKNKGKKASETKEKKATPNKKDRSSNNNADTAWTAPDDGHVANCTWEQLEPSQCWEDDAEANMENQEEAETLSEYKSCCQTSPNPDLGSPQDSFKTVSPSGDMKTANEHNGITDITVANNNGNQTIIETRRNPNGEEIIYKKTLRARDLVTSIQIKKF